jgi:hypothetical protein
MPHSRISPFDHIEQSGAYALPSKFWCRIHALQHVAANGPPSDNNAVELGNPYFQLTQLALHPEERKAAPPTSALRPRASLEVRVQGSIAAARRIDDPRPCASLDGKRRSLSPASSQSTLPNQRSNIRY